MRNNMTDGIQTWTQTSVYAIFGILNQKPREIR